MAHFQLGVDTPNEIQRRKPASRGARVGHLTSKKTVKSEGCPPAGRPGYPPAHLPGPGQTWRRALLLAIVVALALCLALRISVGQAQGTDQVLVSNLGQSGAGHLVISGHSSLTYPNAHYATTFTTANSGTVTKVTVGASAVDETYVPRMRIFADSSGAPGTALHTLTSPSTVHEDAVLPHELRDAVYTSSGYDLAANTTYWLVIDNGGTSISARLGSTSSSDEDSNGTPGWIVGKRPLRSERSHRRLEQCQQLDTNEAGGDPGPGHRAQRSNGPGSDWVWTGGDQPFLDRPPGEGGCSDFRLQDRGVGRQRLNLDGPGC